MSFQNCHIAGVSVDGIAYRATEQKRGAKDFIVSSSSLRDFAFCPSKWVRGHKKPDTAATRYGNLLDTLVLTPELYAGRYVTRPLTYKTKGMKCPSCGSITDSAKCAKCKCERVPCELEKEWSNMSDTCAAWTIEQEKAGKTVIESDGSDKFPGLKQALAAKARLMEDDLCREFLESCDFQVHVKGEWLDSRKNLDGKEVGTGLIIPCKCLIDLQPRADSRFAACLGDLKTTRSAYPPFFEIDARSMGYDVQAAWNLDMFNNATKEKRDRWTWILSENAFPWEPGRAFAREASEDDAELGAGKIDDGRMLYEAHMAYYCDCMLKGKWPGYCDGPESVGGFIEIRHNEFKDGPAIERAQRRVPSAPAEENQPEEQFDPTP